MKIRYLAAAWLTIVCGSAAMAQGPTPESLMQINSVMWTQQSVEHRAATAAMYRAAGAALLNASRQVGWASMEKVR
jgi:hypothetical protein